MPFALRFSTEAKIQLEKLNSETTKAGNAANRAVRKALAYLEQNPRHPSLNTHEYNSLSGSSDEKVWEAYAQNQTPGAYRIFFHYGPAANVITVIAITPHP